jgi:hypothetical protein
VIENPKWKRRSHADWPSLVSGGVEAFQVSWLACFLDGELGLGLVRGTEGLLA